MFKVLIIGYSGQLASSLKLLVKDAVLASRSGPLNLDLTKIETISDRLNAINPDLIINAAGMTAVDKCEVERNEAYLVNGISVGEIARYSRKKGIRFIHISTDYVFDGKQGNYNEDSIPNPINFYGMSKLIGDILAFSCDSSLIVRTSGIFGYSQNFPVYVLERLRMNEKVFVFDGFYSPIFTGLLAKAVERLTWSELTGILNVAGARISRKEFAIRIAERFGLNKELVIENEGEIKFIARRPQDSSLDITSARKLINFNFYTTDANLEEFFILKKSK